MSLLIKINHIFLRTKSDFIADNGVESVAFWKLGLQKSLSRFDGEDLRREIAQSLIHNTFSSSHVAAFFWLLQSQLPSHSMYLWTGEVIPLLAGAGDDRQGNSHRLSQAFQNERPLRSALREFLVEHKRAEVYEPGTPFWFVKAAIGECALMRISEDFAAQFFDEAWKVGRIGRGLPELLNHQFKVSLEKSGLGGDERRKVETLRECMVESAQSICKLAKFSVFAIQPLDGWTLETLLRNAEQEGISIATLPKLAIDLIRSRIEVGISKFTADKLFDLHRQNPDLKLEVNNEPFPFSLDQPIPITDEALLVFGNTKKRIVITDELGRTAQEIVEIAKHKRLGVWNLEGGFHWKIAFSEFEIPHVKFRHRKAQPVKPALSDVAYCWIWCGRHFEAEAIPGATPVPHIKAWPSLDRSKEPVLFICEVKMSNCKDGVLELEVEGQPVWKENYHQRWVSVKKNVPVKVGGATKLLLRLRTVDGLEVEKEMEFAWPIPCFFNSGRRVKPGYARVDGNSNVSLFSKDPPKLHNAVIEKKLDGVGFTRYDLKADEESASWSVAASEVQWKVNRQKSHNFSLRLIAGVDAAQNNGIDVDRFSLSGTDTKLFFSEPPRLIISVYNPDQGEFELEDFLDKAVIFAGYSDSPEPDVQLNLASIKSKLEIVRQSGQVEVRLSTVHISTEIFGTGDFRIKKVSLADWGYGEVRADQDVEFLLLPYDQMYRKPITPVGSGGVILCDSSGLFDDLEMQADQEGGIPKTGESSRQHTLRSKLPQIGFDLTANQELPFAGFWPYLPEINFFDSLLNKVELGVAFASNECNITFETLVLGEPVSDVEFNRTGPVYISEIINKDDLIWDIENKDDLSPLDNPHFEVRCLYNGEVLASIRFDTSIFVKNSNVENRRVSESGRYVLVDLLVEAIPGKSDLRTLTIQGKDEEGNCLPPKNLEFKPSIKPEKQTVDYEFRASGNFELEILNFNNKVIRSEEVAISKVQMLPDVGILLDDILRYGYDVDALLDVYSAIQEIVEPWGNLQIRIKLSRIRDAITQRGSIEYRLVDTLSAMLEETPRSISEIELVKFDEVPANALTPVGIVVMQLQFFSHPAIRCDLPGWSDSFRRVMGLYQDRNLDLMALAAIADCLCSGEKSSGTELELLPWSLARPEFIAFLREKRIINGI